MPQSVLMPAPEDKNLSDTSPEQALPKTPKPEEIPMSSQKKAVAEWQNQMKSGKCESILVVKRAGSGSNDDAVSKHLESFVNAMTKVQREERDRQHAILEKMLAKRKEELQAKGKRFKRTTIKKGKSQVSSSPACQCPTALTAAAFARARRCLL